MIADLHGESIDPNPWGYKAARLNACCGLGVVVPPGLCLQSAVVGSGGAHHALESWLDVHQPSRLVIRTSSTLEDLPDRAHAGRTISIANCPPEAIAILRIVQNDVLPRQSEDEDMSVIVQEQVDASLGGVAFYTPGELLIEGSRHSTDAVTSGIVPDFRISMNDGVIDARAELPLAPVRRLAARLQETCEHLHGHFGFDIDFEWAWVFGGVVGLQVRPLTVRPEGWVA